LMVPFDFAQRVLRDGFRHQIQWQHEVQRAAGRTAETGEPRFAVPGLVYILEVHVRQYRLLRSVEQCTECIGLLAERIRPKVRVGAVLLRRHARRVGLCGVQSALWPRKDAGKECQRSCQPSHWRLGDQPHPLLAHRMANASLWSPGQFWYVLPGFASRLQRYPKHN
jgi:hypothetical protein